MIYYKYDYLPNETAADGGAYEEKRVAAKMSQFCKEMNSAACFGVTALDTEKVTVCAAFTAEYLQKNDAFEQGAAALNYVFGGGDIIKITELSEKSFANLCRTASRRRLICADDDFEKLGLDLDDICRSDIGCEFIAADDTELADGMCCNATLLPELKRIRSGSGRKFCGHPVHYVIRTTDRELNHKLTDLLVGELYRNGRLLSRRYTEVELREMDKRYCGDVYDIYRRSRGGTMVLRCDQADTADREYASTGTDAEELLALAKSLSCSVLTVLCADKGENKALENFKAVMKDTVFVEISEDVLNAKAARAHLKKLAGEKGVSSPRGLFSCLNKSASFTVRDLSKTFSGWYDTYLRTKAYPAYKRMSAPHIERKKPIGSAYKELDAMIGLDNAKKALLDAVNYFKAQKIFADMDAFCGKPSLHMVFTGNPGTAKTTAARLFSQIMHENGVLSTGYFVEVGRSDLVGKYVGWTAKIVKEAFRDAKGGVLFIDEAYSLLDDRGGSYGDEAINTIVQEMENMRDDVCVIFAGYPDKMDTFLKRNPGLSSRIAFHVNFPDYSPEELLLISRYIAGGKKRTFSPEAEALLKENFESIHEDRYFGNGRYVRNIIDKALMRQAGRLLRIGYDKVGANDISVITADDIVLDPVNGREAKTIGFR